MKKTIKFSSNEYRNLAEEIRKMKSKFESQNSNTQNSIIYSLAESVEKEIDKNISKTQYEDGSHDLTTILEKRDNAIVVGMKGEQAVYDEFGTGTEGESNQHPEKDGKGLNAYNSGPTIRKASKRISDLTAIPQGEKYWTYKKDGVLYYTTGIPAGRQVYNAYRTVKKNQKEIIKKAVEKILKNEE